MTLRYDAVEKGLKGRYGQTDDRQPHQEDVDNAKVFVMKLFD